MHRCDLAWIFLTIVKASDWIVAHQQLLFNPLSGGLITNFADVMRPEILQDVGSFVGAGKHDNIVRKLLVDYTHSRYLLADLPWDAHLIIKASYLVNS